MANKIDSNITGLAFAEETSLKVLPSSPIWYELEPNSYSDFGGKLTSLARQPIDPSRQNKKGSITDLDASGGFNSDFTQNNFTRLLQGFFFADAREKPSTAPLNGNKIQLTAIITSAFQAANGMNIFLNGHLVKASKMSDRANNGLAKVTKSTNTEIEVSKSLAAETKPSPEAFIEVCGFEFAAGSIDIVASTSSIKLVSATTDFTTLALNVGEWIFVGGDATINQFVNNKPGYARIKSISEKELYLDETTFTAVSETGTGLEIQIFFGLVIRNEKDPNIIKRRSYNIERQLGKDANGTQSEYLEGAIANEFTLNIPQANKLNADVAFVAMDNIQRNGTQGIKNGTRVASPGEAAFNTSSDIYRIRLNIVEPNVINSSALFGYISEAKIEIKNNVSSNKAIATLGAFDASVGNFEVSGSITAYFSTVEAVKAVRNNSDVGLNLIVAQKSNNAAFVFDMPLISLGGGVLNVEKDAPIKIPVDTNAAECESGYTLLSSFLPYVPNVAIPT